MSRWFCSIRAAPQSVRGLFLDVLGWNEDDDVALGEQAQETFHSIPVKDHEGFTLTRTNRYMASYDVPSRISYIKLFPSPRWIVNETRDQVNVNFEVLGNRQRQTIFLLGLGIFLKHKTSEKRVRNDGSKSNMATKKDLHSERFWQIYSNFLSEIERKVTKYPWFLIKYESLNDLSKNMATFDPELGKEWQNLAKLIEKCQNFCDF